MAYGHLLMGDHLLSTLERHGLYMALSTKTAYSTEPAHFFCEALADRLGLTATQRDHVELALHEALANGLLHGNLEVSSAERQTLEGFRRYCREIEAQLQDPLFAGRRIEVSAVCDASSLTVTVSDNGAGYDEAPSSDDPLKKSGRGLRLMHEMADQVTIADKGRIVSMRFSR